MKRNAGARESENKLEARFAALTSGLLARKGQAAPSNSPVADAAEETEAYTLDTALIPRKLKPAAAPVAAATAAPATKQTAPAPQNPPAPAQKAAPPKAPPPEKAQKSAAPPKSAPAPLAVINESAGYLKDLLSLESHGDHDAELIEQVDAILESVQRCGAITTGLLGFAREMNLHLKPVHLEDLIDRVLGFHRKEAEYRGITIRVDVADDVPTLESDPGRLQQIFLNLVGNAFQAMNAGDTLDINARYQEPDTVRVEVSDTGCGIPRENLQRVFEPFFTTKGEHHGTGLGLSITYNLVNKLGGKIDVKSEVGVGTTFIVVLPVRRGEEEADEGVAG